MTVPAAPTLPLPTVTIAQDTGDLLKVTLASGMVLWIPKDEANADYKAVQAWAAGGGSITN